MNRKWIAVAAAALLTLIILIISVPKLIGGSKFDTYGDGQLAYTSTYNYVVFYNNQKVVAEIDDISIFDPILDLSRTKAVVTGDVIGNDGGTLYLIDSNGKKPIDENVVSYVISDDGTSVAYTKDYDSEEGTATLMLYDGKESIEIEDNISTSYGEAQVVISPNGSAVTYVEADGSGFTGYISVNGKPPEKLGDNKFCIALSDNAKYVYYIIMNPVDYSTELYVMSGDNEIMLEENFMYPDTILFFNKDYSEIIFSDGDRTYISENGREKESIIEEPTTLLLPDNIQYKDDFSSVKVAGIKSFSNMLLAGDSGIYHVDNKFETKKVVNDYNMSTVSNDLQQIAYTDLSNNLYLVTNVHKKKPTRIELDKAKMARHPVFSEDGENIYYLNHDSELFSINSYNEPMKISDDVYGGFLVTISEKIFFLEDYKNYGDLYYAFGSNKVAIDKADKVDYFQRVGNGIVYKYKDGNKDIIYGSKNGEDFSKICEVNDP